MKHGEAIISNLNLENIFKSFFQEEKISLVTHVGAYRRIVTRTRVIIIRQLNKSKDSGQVLSFSGPMIDENGVEGFVVTGWYDFKNMQGRLEYDDNRTKLSNKT